MIKEQSGAVRTSHISTVPSVAICAMGTSTNRKHSNRQMRSLVRGTLKLAVAALALSFAATSTGATEKYWLASQADLIVVATYSQKWVYPWFDGWHVSGSLDVHEILHGSTVPHQIRYQFRCGWAECRKWPPPRIAEIFGAKAIWFLRSEDRRIWEPPGNGGIDPGVRGIEQKHSFQEYIRKYKRQRNVQ